MGEASHKRVKDAPKKDQEKEKFVYTSSYRQCRHGMDGRMIMFFLSLCTKLSLIDVHVKSCQMYAFE